MKEAEQKALADQALADFAARGWIQLAAKSVLVTDNDRLRKRAR